MQFAQIHYSKAPKDSKYLGKSIMVKEESNGSFAIATVIKVQTGKPLWQGVTLSPVEAMKVAQWLILKTTKQ